MSKTWKELAEELKILAEVILEQAKRAFQEGDIDRGILLTKEFRSAIKTAGDLNMIAQGASELDTEFETDDLEKALGIKEELEEEEEEEILEEEADEDELEEDEEEELDDDDFEEIEEETEDEADTLEPSDDISVEQRKKIVNQVGESLVTLEQILRGIARKKS
jgi:hypothetical protein